MDIFHLKEITNYDAFSELGITGIISIWLLQVIDLSVASDSEPAINVSGEAGHQYGMLARYR